MEKETLISVKVGLFVIIGVICLVLGIYLIGSKKNLFSSNLRVSALFTNVSGLQPGNNVRFSGINVGTVDDILLLNDSTIQVNMTIDKKSSMFIRKDATATIGTDGLMGNRLVNISMGSPSSRVIKDGDVILGTQPVQVDEMLRVLQESNKNVSGITSDIKKITSTINTGRGPVWKMLSDTNLANKMDAVITNLESTSAHASRMSNGMAGIVDDVRKGKGSLGKLLSDTTLENRLSAAVTDVSNAAGTLSSATEKIEQGQGLLGMLVADTSASQHVQRSLENIEQGTKSFNENMEALKHNFLFRKYFKKQKQEKQ